MEKDENAKIGVKDFHVEKYFLLYTSISNLKDCFTIFPWYSIILQSVAESDIGSFFVI